MSQLQARVNQFAYREFHGETEANCSKKIIGQYHYRDVQGAAVFGAHSDKYNEEVCAWIKVRSGASLLEDEVCHFLTQTFAYVKVPRYIKFVDPFPMTGTGKIQKFKMRELMYQELYEDINA